jgi:hypothetical protein
MGEVAQTMYTHVSKCKNVKIIIKLYKKKRIKGLLHVYVGLLRLRHVRGSNSNEGKMEVIYQG